MPLTPKQNKFVDEYCIDLNAKQAAIRAGYSEKTAEQQASRLLSNVKVSKELAKRFAARQERTEITQDYVLARLVIEAERDDEGSSHSARVSALEKLGKHLGMFKDRIEHELKAEIKGIDFTPFNE